MLHGLHPLSIARRRWPREEFGFLVSSNRDEQQHFANLKPQFTRTVLFPEFDGIWDINAVPVRKTLEQDLSRDDERDFQSARWTWPLTYNVYEWARGCVILEACFKSDKIGTVLKSAFCCLSHSVCRPSLENELIKNHNA